MIIKTVKELDNFCSLVDKTKVLFLDTETTGLAWTDRLLGISLATGTQEDLITCYVPWDTVPVTAIMAMLENTEITKVLHNATFDMKILMRNGFIFKGDIFDTMIAYWFLDPKWKGIDLKGLMLKLFKIDSPDYTQLLRIGGQTQTKTLKNGKVKTKVIPAKDLTEVPLEIVAKYAENDVRYTSMLYHYCLERLKDHPAKELLYTVDFKMIPILVAMELEGTLVDIKKLRSLSQGMYADIQELEKKLDAITGRHMNYHSTAQVSQYLFNELNLKPFAYSKKTSVPKVDDYLLSRYAKQGIEFCALLKQYKNLKHMKKTYLDGLTVKADEDGRVHGNFKITGTETGRLSCSKPNLQNIPKADDLGKEIRKCFIARPGHVLIRADFSQMELRMLAHLAQDKRMIYGLRSGGDFHIKTAQFMFPGKEITKDCPERSAAKTVNFGVAYGLTPQSLAKDLDITFDEADGFMKAHARSYAASNRWKWRTRDEVQRTKAVTTVFGRVRDLSASKGNIANQALNTPIQGACSDVVKVAMLRLADKLEGKRAKVLLQVHDEVVVECPEEDAEEISLIMKQAMESANIIFFKTMPGFFMTCPFEVEVGYGKSWGEGA